MTVAGGGLRRITRTRANEYHPELSPDGRRLAFSRTTGDRRSGLKIVISDPDGSAAVVAERGRGNDVDPSWSPDGSRLAFFSDRAARRAVDGYYREQLYTAAADGSGVERFLETRTNDRQPVFLR